MAMDSRRCGRTDGNKSFHQVSVDGMQATEEKHPARAVRWPGIHC